MGRMLPAALFYGALWFAWSGYTQTVILIFAAAGIAISLFFGNRFSAFDEEGFPIRIALHFPMFFLWLCWETIKANIEVSLLILSPKMNIAPHLIRVPATQKTALGQVVHANTITITPGTISLDMRDDQILVHALSEDGADEESEGRVNRWVSWLESRGV